MTFKIEPSLEDTKIITLPMVRNFSTGGGYGPEDTLTEGDHKLVTKKWQGHPPVDLSIIGKPQVLDKMDWKNPILFGTAVFSHPSDDPHLFERRPVKRILVPGAWMKELWKPFWDETIAVWPVGIDTDRWHPASAAQKRIDVLLYDKVMWDRERAETHARPQPWPPTRPAAPFPSARAAKSYWLFPE